LCSQASSQTQRMYVVFPLHKISYSPCKRSLNFLQKSPRVTYMCSQASTTTRLTYLLFSRAKYFFPLQKHLEFSAQESYSSMHVLTGLFGDPEHVCCIPLHTMVYSPLQKKPTFPAKEPNTNIHVIPEHVCCIPLHTMVCSPLQKKPTFPAKEPYISRKRAQH